MDNFLAGFSWELTEIMSKEAAPESVVDFLQRPSLAGVDTRGMSINEKLQLISKSREGHRVAKSVGRGGRRVASGALAHKIINPEAGVGSAVRTGAGMAAGGTVGVALAKQLGFKGAKGALVGSFLGSAAGIRAMRKKKKKKKSSEELLDKAMGKGNMP